MAFSEKSNQKLEPEPRKTGKSVFIKKKRDINNNMVAVLISCDPKGNKHLQVASRGRISAKAINPVLKDKLEATFELVAMLFYYFTCCSF